MHNVRWESWGRRGSDLMSYITFGSFTHLRLAIASCCAVTNLFPFLLIRFVASAAQKRRKWPVWTATSNRLVVDPGVANYVPLPPTDDSYNPFVNVLCHGFSFSHLTPTIIIDQYLILWGFWHSPVFWVTFYNFLQSAHCLCWEVTRLNLCA